MSVHLDAFGNGRTCCLCEFIESVLQLLSVLFKPLQLRLRGRRKKNCAVGTKVIHHSWAQIDHLSTIRVVFSQKNGGSMANVLYQVVDGCMLNYYYMSFQWLMTVLFFVLLGHPSEHWSTF